MRNVLITVLVLCFVCLLQAQAPPPAQPDDRQVWDGIYAGMIRRDESFLPNAFLVKVVEGSKPGTALDIAMGQGRNALMLAQRGWEVTGFDISDLAIDTAKAQAQKLALKLNATVANLRAFDYGVERYDMAVAIYANGFVTGRASRRRDGEFLLDREERAAGSVRQLWRSQDGVVRLPRSVL